MQRMFKLPCNRVCYWKDWCWSWSANILAIWCEELTHWKRPWCWERFKAGGQEDDRGWGGWMASRIWWTWVWANSGSWWWSGKPGVLQSIGSQRVGHDWVTEVNWECDKWYKIIVWLWMDRCPGSSENDQGNVSAEVWSLKSHIWKKQRK